MNMIGPVFTEPRGFSIALNRTEAGPRLALEIFTTFKPRSTSPVISIESFGGTVSAISGMVTFAVSGRVSTTGLVFFFGRIGKIARSPRDRADQEERREPGRGAGLSRKVPVAVPDVAALPAARGDPTGDCKRENLRGRA
jgi:hypothetical protein